MVNEMVDAGFKGFIPCVVAAPDRRQPRFAAHKRQAATRSADGFLRTGVRSLSMKRLGYENTMVCRQTLPRDGRSPFDCGIIRNFQRYIQHAMRQNPSRSSMDVGDAHAAHSLDGAWRARGVPQIRLRVTPLPTSKDPIPKSENRVDFPAQVVPENPSQVRASLETTYSYRTIPAIVSASLALIVKNVGTQDQVRSAPIRHSRGRKGEALGRSGPARNW
ncbi:hypothetical protein [Nocardia sp. R6R-6]|uniref:hypothetical protein n=1 Tax=Nocardia sp. R6R-6 TaxID=3459303 RepID=UPI00403DE02D